MTKADLTLFIAIGATLLLIIGTSLFGIRPLLGRYRALQTEQQQTAAELAELEERASILAKYAQDRAEIEDLGGRALTYLPTTVAAAPFVMDIEAMAKGASTNVPTLTFQDTKAAKAGESALSEHAITLRVEGGFDQLKTFLRSLEENLRFSSLGTVSVSIQQDNLSLQTSGVIYSKAENKKPKDTSLTIDKAMKDLLEKRKPFGAAIPTSGPNRGDPFAEF